MTKHYTKAFSPQEKQAAIAKYADLIKYSARYSDTSVWEMYMRHEPEPHVLLFKRDKDYDQKHPPLTERRTQPQVQQRQAVTQNSS
ncbi:hypothetical protein QFC20_002186 [Naganishia adeliensis]|uniref:Uncharacterized protein n=1 Tax=Naganishia adeliensis TaxID=92952 RepID=A0ACC2WMF2_9TREE|nr:hypothetical protein QFC20_002186 [Naganishia adeliensis]